MKNETYKYIGCFVDYDALCAAVAHLPYTRLAKGIEHPHVTFVYKPETVDVSLFGRQIKLTAIGYGCDGENEGLLVQIASDDARILKMAEAIVVPHITLSVSETGEAVNTAKLTFTPIAPFEVEGRFGGYCYDDHVDTEGNL